MALNVHAPITSQAHEWLRCSTTKKKTESKGKDAAATAAPLWFFPSPEIDSNSHQVKCLPLLGVASQSLPKKSSLILWICLWSWSCWAHPAQMLLPTLQHPFPCCQVPGLGPFHSSGQSVWTRLQYVTNYLTARKSPSRCHLLKTEHVLAKVIIWT